MNNTTLIKFYNQYKKINKETHTDTLYILYKNYENKTKIYSFHRINDDKSIISFMDKILEFELNHPNINIFIGIALNNVRI